MKVHLVASSKDQSVVEDFKLYTAMLRRLGILELTSQEEALVVVVLVSPHLMLDNFCQQALYVAEYKKQLIIPVTVSPCEWKEDALLGRLQHIPRWKYLCDDTYGEIWMEMVKELRAALERFQIVINFREASKGQS